MAAVPTDLLDRIRALERQVQALAGRVSIRPAQSRLYDGAGVELWSPSASGGMGRPYLDASGWWGATEAPAYTTTSATFTSVMHLPWIRQHPSVTAYYLAKCSDGTTSGEARLVDDAGVPIGPTVTLAVGAYVYGSVTGKLAGAHLAATYLHWQVRRTAGSGTVGVRGLSTVGVQS